MFTVLSEIEKLRNGEPYILDTNNSNRYRVVVSEQNGTKTAYCFSSPILDSNRQFVKLKFTQNDNKSEFIGSNCKVTLEQDKLQFVNGDGKCNLSLPEHILTVTDRCAYCSKAKIFPTVNGLVFKVKCDRFYGYNIALSMGGAPYGVRANNKSVSIMTTHFKPFITLSGIGAFDSNGLVVAPCNIEFRQKSDAEFFINVSTSVENSSYVMFEVNCHEPKLFLDTTVESRQPKDNNAFGGTDFIGNTDMFGEQWLYSRPELSLIYELFGESINSVVMNIPNLNNCKSVLSAYGILKRFCSFGSNWENKVPSTSKLGSVTKLGDYHRIDITDILTDKYANRLTLTEGLILKPIIKDGHVAVISTGDSCYSPQILEINFG